MSFGFGAKPLQTPGFGAQPAQPSGSITFGTPVAQTTPQFGLGTNTFNQTPASGFQLGSNTQPATGLFGSTPATPNPSFAFSTPQNAAASQPQNTTLSFGAPATAQTTGFTLGAATPATTGFSLGGATGLSFGGTTTASTGIQLGAPTTTAGLTFGTQTTQSSSLFSSKPNTGLSFGAEPALAGAPAPALGSSFANPTTSSSTLSFGAPASTASGGLNFGFGQSTSGGLFGLGGAPTKTTASTSTVATTSSFSAGLGGITTQQKPLTTTKTEISPKEEQLPNEILQTVEQFKNFVKEQKSFSSDVSRCSVKEFRMVESEIDAVNKLLKEVEVVLQKNRAEAQKLKYDTAKGLQHADIAQRTFNTPPGLQYENVAPLNFFIDLADGFERKIQELKVQIENTNSYIRNLGSASNITSQDLSMGMRRLHEAFVALAGRLQSVHSQVERQKEEYLNFRKYVLNDVTNVFEQPNSQAEVLNMTVSGLKYTPPTLASGPTPFNSITSTSFNLIQNQSQPPAYPGSTLGGNLNMTTSGTTFGIQTAPTSTLFGNTTFGQSSSFQFNSASSTFNLQKPPVGNKRGKQ